MTENEIIKSAEELCDKWQILSSETWVLMYKRPIKLYIYQPLKEWKFISSLQQLEFKAVSEFVNIMKNEYS